MNRLKEIGCRTYKIQARLRFDDSVRDAGNPPTLAAEDRMALIDELDTLYGEKRLLTNECGERLKK